MIAQLEKNWRFHLQTAEEKNNHPQKEFWDRGFDDSSWRTIQIPHDWAIEYPFEKTNSSGTAYLPGGTGWYRFHFTTNHDTVGKHAELFFEGVYKRCMVWCNSYYLGSWKNGFTSFSFDITQQLKGEGEDNCIVVCVNHDDIADSRWYTGSGIMRPVYIRFSGLQHFTDDSVSFHTERNTHVHIDLHIQNTAQEEASCTVTAELFDKNGQLALIKNGLLVISKGQKGHIHFEDDLMLPQLWSPDEPTLYTLKAKIENGEELLDYYECKIGIREIQFNSNTGFTCNGIAYKLKGVCLHEDAGCLGNAVPEEVWEHRLNKLKSAGCNAIRMSHNPHSETLYTLCDKLGFFVIDELFDEWENPKNKWWQGHNVYPPSHEGYYADFPQCHEQDIRSFVISRRNHASIIMWSIGNEIDYPNDPYCSPAFSTTVGNNDVSKPVAEQQYNPDHPDISRLPVIAKMLAEELRQYDTTRPVTMAIAFPEFSNSKELYNCLDVIGYNYKEQFYAADHEKYPEKPFLGSENSHGYKQWKIVEDTPYISGQFLWTGIDYLGEAKGWPIHASPSGLIDMAGYEKPEFYFRKSLWSQEPFAYVCTTLHGQNTFTHNWNYSTGDDIDIRIYTNAPTAKLIVNGIEKMQGMKNEDGYISFTLPYENGILCAEVSNKIRDEIATTQAACNMATTVYNGKKMQIVEVSMVDDFGSVVETDSSPVSVTVDGAGELAGIENGDIADVTEYSSNWRRAHNGRLTIYIRSVQSGKVTIRLDSINKKTKVITYVITQ